MTARSFTVEPRAAGERLDVFLAAALERPRSQAQRLVRTQLVLVNDQPERTSYVVQPSDVVRVSEPPAPLAKPDAPDLPVIYEDDDLIVIDKPAGIAVHPGAATHITATVADFARPRTTDLDPDRPGIVHRLDRDTSGLLIIAKNEPAKAFMQAAFKRHEVHKAYTLLVVGRVDQEQAVIKLPLGRDPAHPLRQAVEAAGREAITPYIATRYFDGYTQIEAKPETGRTHQLRVHFAALGHPVAGDIVYGPPKRPLGLKRQFLHACSIEFTAPSGERLKLVSPLPPDLSAVVDRLDQAQAAQ